MSLTLPVMYGSWPPSTERSCNLAPMVRSRSSSCSSVRSCSFDNLEDIYGSGPSLNTSMCPLSRKRSTQRPDIRNTLSPPCRPTPTRTYRFEFRNPPLVKAPCGVMGGALPQHVSPTHCVPETMSPEGCESVQSDTQNQCSVPHGSTLCPSP